MDCMVYLVGVQNKLLANTTPQMHPDYESNPPTFLPPLPPQVHTSTFMLQRLPCDSNDVYPVVSININYLCVMLVLNEIHYV